MYLVKPSPLALEGSNLPDASASEYSATATYDVGSVVKVSSATPVHTYKSLISPNVGNAPATSKAAWEDLGPTNRWAMLDTMNSSQSTSSGSIVATVSGAMIDTVVLMNVVASRITIEQFYGNDLVEALTSSLVDLHTEDIVDWYSYFVTGLSVRSALVESGWRKLPYAVFRVTIYPLTGQAACGMLVAGEKKQLGDTGFGVSAGILDYSRKSTDEFGNTYLSQGAYAKKASVPVQMDNANINDAYALLASVRSKPTLWNCNNNDSGGFEPLLIFGFARDFGVVIPGPVVSDCNLEIEGLI